MGMGLWGRRWRRGILGRGEGCWEMLQCFLPSAAYEQFDQASPIGASSPIHHATHWCGAVQVPINLLCPWFL
jgi:hypothetical protein